jgi:4-amino-4-deoxy-L-arabinose transferase-like glycosyltransferase
MKFLPFASLIVPLLLSLYLWIGTPHVPLHGDEPTQMYMGRDTYYLLVQGDFARVRYDPRSPEPDQQELRLLNGTLPKYLIGLGMIQMGYTLDNWQKPYDWGADFAYNRANGHIPPDETLAALRYPHTALTIAALWGVYALGWALGGAGVGTVAALAFGLNPAVLLDGRRLMMEAALLAFSVWSAAATWGVLRGLLRPSWPRWGLPLALAFGLLSGLALASKHTAIFTVGALWLALSGGLIYRLVRVTRAHALRWLLSGLAALLVMVGVFYALNPAWWGDPLGRAQTVLALRQDLLRGQTAFFGGYADFADQTAGFFRQAFAVQPQYYQVDTWRAPLAEAIRAYEAGGFAGLSVGALGGLAWLIASLVGVIALLRRGAAGGLLLVWGAAMISLTWLITPLEWQRYYLPIYPWLALVGALGVAQLARPLWRKRP